MKNRGWGLSLLGCALLTSLAWASDETAERDFRPPYLSQATGPADPGPTGKNYPWPVKVLSIGNTIGSYQLYSASLSAAYFHHGTDIRADSGALVQAIVGGKVINVQNYMSRAEYWEIAILDSEGYIWQYHHIARPSIPNEVIQAFKQGGTVADGAKLGQVVYWPVVSEGERYNHIHVNVIGEGKQYLNIFNFLEPLPDTATPQIIEIGILKNGQKARSSTVSGSYSIYAEVGDLVLSRKFIVPPHITSYYLDGDMPTTVWAFDSLPGVDSITKFVNTLYIPKLTCGNYSCRHPVMDLSFSPLGNRTFPRTPGKHTISVRVTDAVGNTDLKTFDWTVTQ